MIVVDIPSTLDVADETNAVVLLVRSALAEHVVDGSSPGTTVATAATAMATLKLDHAVIVELARSGTGLQLTSTIVGRTGTPQVAVVEVGDGDTFALAKAVVDQVAAVTHAAVKPVPEISFGQLRPFADAMRLAHDDAAGAIAALDDADPAVAAKVNAIARGLGGLATAATTPAAKLIVARILPPADPADVRAALTRALAATPADDRRLSQLVGEALASLEQRRMALAFASTVDYTRLTAELHGKLLELAARAAATGSSSTAITSHIGLNAALAGIDSAAALALLEPRELDKGELDVVDRLLASHPSTPKAIATRVRAELAMRRHDGTEAAAISAYVAAAPTEPRAQLYKVWAAAQPTVAATGSGSARVKPNAAAVAERREPVLVVIGALLGMGAVLVVLLLLMSLRRRPAKVVVPAPVVRDNGMVMVRIVIAAEDRQGIAIWTTDRRACVYTDATGEATLELAPGDHLLNFESSGDVVTLSVGIGAEPSQRLELELLRAAKPPQQQQAGFPPEPPSAPVRHAPPPRPASEPPNIALAPTIAPDNNHGFEDTALAAAAVLENLGRGKTEPAAEDEPPKKASTHKITPFPTMSGYAPPPAAVMPERPTPMPPPKLPPVETAVPAPLAKPDERSAPNAIPQAIDRPNMPAPKSQPVAAAPKPAPKPVERPQPAVPTAIEVSTAPTAPKAIVVPQTLKPVPTMPAPKPIERPKPIAVPKAIQPGSHVEVTKLALLPIPGGTPPAPKSTAMDLELGAAGSTAAAEPAPTLPASFVLEHTSEAQRMGNGASTAEITHEGARALENTDTKIRPLPNLSAVTAVTVPAETDAAAEVKDGEAPKSTAEVDVAKDDGDEANVEERAEPTTVTPMEIPGEPTLVTPEEKQADVGDKVEVTIVGPPVAPLITKPRPPIFQRRPEPEPAGPLRLGNRYQVDEAARGAAGTIMKGYDERLKRQVGVELYPVLDPIATAKHVNTIAKLEHANLVRVYELVVEAGKAYLICEALSGKSLDQHIVERGIYPWLEAVTVIDSVCAGLEYAHGRSIIHRAIRPAVVVMQVTTAKLGGFAIAPDLTAAGYVAPEILAGAAPDRRSDIYSIGATLWQALAGAPPPAEDRKPLPDVPKKLQMLMDAMLSKAPNERPTSVQALRAGFKSLSDF